MRFALYPVQNLAITLLVAGLDNACFTPSPLYRLSERCKTHPQMEREGGLAFIESLAELLRRLLDYRTVAQGERDLHMHVMFNLLVRAIVCMCNNYCTLRIFVQGIVYASFLCFFALSCLL